MVKASGQIEQDLRALQDKTEVMESALDPLYEGYLKALSEAGQRQLVMAAYYLCTQAYPDKFLALSWDERNRLQESLQKLSAQIFEQLTQQREEAKKRSRRSQSSDGLAFLQKLLASRMAGAAAGKVRGGKDASRPDEEDTLRQDRSTSELFSPDEDNFVPPAEEEDSEESAFDISILDMDEPSESEQRQGEPETDARDRADEDIDFEMEVPAADDRLSIAEEEDLLAALEGLARRSLEMRNGEMNEEGTGRTEGDEENSEGDDQNAEEKPLTPIHLVKQQMLIEKAIRDVFKSVSEEANDLLQKANVMPSFPKSLLAAATESGGIGEPANAVPNVVRVSVRVMHGEALLENEDGDEDRQTRSRRSDADRQDSSRSEAESSDDERRDDEIFGRGAEDERRDEGRDEDRAHRRSERSRRSRQDRAASRRRSQRAGRGSRRGRDEKPSRIIPYDVVEMEALPELAAISLRLSEVEFADPTASAWRSRLRQKLGELKKLGVRYKKTQRSLETAQAEDAWRSSWTVHNPDANS